MAKTELTRAINLHQVGHENVHGALAVALSKSKGILAAYPYVDRSDLKSYLRNPAVVSSCLQFYKQKAQRFSVKIALQRKNSCYQYRRK